MIGDLNEDGKITASDARLALRIPGKLENPTDKQSKTVDANFDNKNTASDARKILRVPQSLIHF